MKTVMTLSVRDAKRLESFAFQILKFLGTHKAIEAMDDERMKKVAATVFGPGDPANRVTVGPFAPGVIEKHLVRSAKKIAQMRKK